MTQPVTLFIDDLTLPESARRLLERQLTRHLTFGHRLCFLSQMSLTSAWNGMVTPGALALTQLLQLLVGGPAPFVWLNGPMVITADLSDPFAETSTPLRLQPGLRLALQSVLLVGLRTDALRTEVEALLTGDYHTATDAVLTGDTLPNDWQPGNWHDSRRGGLADLRVFTARPWLNAEAPAARAWENDLAAILQSDALRQEIACGHLRSSLAYQLKHSTLGKAAPPVEVRVLDAVLPHPEIAVPVWRLQALQTVRYAAPRLLSSPPRPREIPEKDWVRRGRVFPRRKQRQENKQIVLGMLLRGDFAERRKAIGLILRYVWLRRPRTVGQWLRSPIRIIRLALRVERKLARSIPHYKVTRGLVKRGYHVGKYGVLHPRRAVVRVLAPWRRHG